MSDVSEGRRPKRDEVDEYTDILRKLLTIHSISYFSSQGQAKIADQLKRSCSMSDVSEGRRPKRDEVDEYTDILRQLLTIHFISFIYSQGQAKIADQLKRSYSMSDVSEGRRPKRDEVDEYTDDEDMTGTKYLFNVNDHFT